MSSPTGEIVEKSSGVPHGEKSAADGQVTCTSKGASGLYLCYLGEFLINGNSGKVKIFVLTLRRIISTFNITYIALNIIRAL